MKKIKIKIIGNGVMPKKGSEDAIAYDVFLPCGLYIRPGRQVVPLDFSIEMPKYVEGKIEARSGFSAKGMEDKYGARMNADVLTGKIDPDYRGIVGVIINSNEKEFFWLERGTRIAQLTFYKVEKTKFKKVKELSKTNRGEGGFGHTGSK